MTAKIYRNKSDESFHISDGTGKFHGPYLTREDAKNDWPRIKRNRDRRERHKVLTDMGLSRVRGALGGVYYE